MGHLIKNGLWHGGNYLVHAKDVRKQNIRGKNEPCVCVLGMKQWSARHGIGWQNLRKNGVTPQQILDTGDARAIMALLKYHRYRLHNG